MTRRGGPPARSTVLFGLVLVVVGVVVGGGHPVPSVQDPAAVDLSAAADVVPVERVAAGRTVEEEAVAVRSASPPIVPVPTGRATGTGATGAPTSSAAVPTPPSVAAADPAASPEVSATTGGAGSAPAEQDLPGWSPLVVQDFEQDAPLGRFADVYPGWAGYDGGRDTSASYGRPAAAQGRYSSRTTTSVRDGVLDQYVHTAAGTPQVVALTPSLDGSWWEGQLHGRYAVRFRSDPVPGYKLAFLLWPSSDDWSQGEIDFPEGSLGGAIEGFSHDVTGDPSGNAFRVDTGVTMGGWHTAVIEWSPGRLTYQLDGRSWTTTDPAAIPTAPMRWVLQTETDLSASAPDPAASGHVLIDWVAAWRWG